VPQRQLVNRKWLKDPAPVCRHDLSLQVHCHEGFGAG
jgi:hypothetical protein